MTKATETRNMKRECKDTTVTTLFQDTLILLFDG